MFIKECRICYENENENEKKLISPCTCNGTSKYIHEFCLDKWRQKNKNHKPYYYCMECNYKYKFGRKYIVENFTIFNRRRVDASIEFCLFLTTNLLLLICTVLISSADKDLYLPSFFLPGNTTSFVNFIKNRDEKSYLYYYSFTTFCFSTIYHLVLFSVIGSFLKNRIRYLQHVFIPYSLLWLASNHNIYLFLHRNNGSN